MSEKPFAPASPFAKAGGYLGCVVVLSVILGGAAGYGLGFGFGLLYAGGRVRQQQYREERQLFEPILASDAAFNRVECVEQSDGGAALAGVVSNQADLDRLRERVIRAVGEKRAKEVLCGVIRDK